MSVGRLYVGRPVIANVTASDTATIATVSRMIRSDNARSGSNSTVVLVERSSLTPLVNSGPRALFGRGIGGPREMQVRDQLLIELGASYCRYHVCTEHTVVTGPPDSRQQAMLAVAAEALTEITQFARPGKLLGEIDDIHRRVLDAAGFATERFAACGYSLGATFRPTWMDVPPMLYSGNPVVMQPGMVLFVHIMVPDTRTGLAAGVGQTIIITEKEAEVISDLPLILHCR
jgi:Xaa-Pro dipeptidase